MNHSESIISLDLGTSSVRSFLYDWHFNRLEGFGAQIQYEVRTSGDGGVEIDPDALFRITVDCLDTVHAQLSDQGKRVVAVGISTFWHCFVGVDTGGHPTAPIIHLFDTRSREQAHELRERIDPRLLHSVTGCTPHTSYWPAKLMWLRKQRGDSFRKTVRWLSVGEFLLLKLTGQTAESTSMVSASGMWDRHRDTYWEEMMECCDVQPSQLSPPHTINRPIISLLPKFAVRWPRLQGIPWIPAFGDGACNSVGSGCATPGTFALMVGTSGAIRTVVHPLGCE